MSYLFKLYFLSYALSWPLSLVASQVLSLNFTLKLLCQSFETIASQSIMGLVLILISYRSSCRFILTGKICTSFDIFFSFVCMMYDVCVCQLLDILLLEIFAPILFDGQSSLSQSIQTNKFANYLSAAYQFCNWQLVVTFMSLVSLNL